MLQHSGKKEISTTLEKNKFSTKTKLKEGIADSSSTTKANTEY